MRSLFLQIFISFWLAMALILVGAIGITATVAWYRFSELSSIGPGQLIDQAARTLSDTGLSGLKTWLSEAVSNHPDLDIYVIDSADADILHRPLPNHIVRWLVLGGRPAAKETRHYAYNWPYGYDLAPGGVTDHSFAFNRSHLLANPTLLAPDGTAYTLIVAWFGATPVDVLGSQGIVFALLGIALLASALVCWWIARYISRPVLTLQMSARTFALGNLDTRVDEQFCKRRDEIGVLAQDFNEMAARLRSQITSKETLIRDISHELRSPLTRLRVALGLAQRNGDLNGQLDRMERDFERLDALIDETLQLSRLSATEPGLVCEDIVLKPLLEDIVSDARLEAGAAGKSVNFFAPLNVFVRGDATLLRRAIDNVVRNAIRFAPPGTSVDISARSYAHGLVVGVRDHGSGVPEQHLERIFEAFYRVAEARDRASGGAGLGLAITARIMELHGGYQTARNAQDGGLIVELFFPGAEVSNEPTADGSGNAVDAIRYPISLRYQRSAQPS